MNTHTNRVIGLVVVIAVAMGLIVSLGACSPSTPAPAPTVTVTQEPTPTPEPTGPSDSDYDEWDVWYEISYDTLESNYKAMSRADRDEVCKAYIFNNPQFESVTKKYLKNEEGLSGKYLTVAHQAFMDVVADRCIG